MGDKKGPGVRDSGTGRGFGPPLMKQGLFNGYLECLAACLDGIDGT